MESSRSNLGGEDPKKTRVVNRYLNYVVAPLKTLTLKEGVLLMEEVKSFQDRGQRGGRTASSGGHRIQVWHCG
jgi:hypothetical protein